MMGSTYHSTGEGGHEGFPVRVGLRSNRLPAHLLVVRGVEAILEGEDTDGPVEETRRAHRPLIRGVEIIPRRARVGNGL